MLSHIGIGAHLPGSTHQDSSYCTENRRLTPVGVKAKRARVELLNRGGLRVGRVWHVPESVVGVGNGVPTVWRPPLVAEAAEAGM